MTSLSAPEPSVRFELSTGISIAADTWGDAANRPVLFVHGGGQTRHAWGGAAQSLAKIGFYTICVDQRGHGDSSWSADCAYALDDFAQDLLALLAQFERRPVIVGASLGGMAALRAEALSEKPVAEALVLVDTTPRMEASGVSRILRWMLDGMEGFGSLDEAADAIAAYLPHRRRPTDYAGLAKNLRLGEDGRYRWHWDPKMIMRWNPDDWEPDQGQKEVQERVEAARHIRFPTLLIRGRLSDVVSEENAREFLEQVPHAEYVDLEDAAHMVAGDRNDAFTASIADFIVRHFRPV